MSPPDPAVSYTALFTLTSAEAVAVLFLWHFSYAYARLPLATTVSYAARTFLSPFRASDYINELIPILTDKPPPVYL